MKRFLVFAFVGLGTAAGQAQPARPRADVVPLVEGPARAGSAVRVALKVTVPEGLHTQSNRPRDKALIPTTLTIDPPPGITVDEIVWPPSIDLVQAGVDKPLAVFEREFLIGATLSLPGSRAFTGNITVPAKLRYQACDANLCYQPTTAEVAWIIHEVPASASAAPDPAHAREFASIKFGTGEKPGSPRPQALTGVPATPQTAPGDVAILDEFAVAGATGGYQGTSDFLAFIRDAEAGVKARGMFEGRGPLAILLLVLVGGLALNLTPCVLPMIPINLAIIGAGAQAQSRGRGFLLGTA